MQHKPGAIILNPVNKQRRSIALLLAAVIPFLLITGCTVQNSGTAQPVVTVRNLPQNILAMTLSVSADDFGTITVPIPDTGITELTVIVPAGTDRTFEITVYPTPENVVTEYKGSQTVDLAAGESTGVLVTLDIESMKILVPDAEGNRIVQIDDMDGPGWIEKNNTALGIGPTIYPWDIDIDGSGRIYFAHNGNTTGGAIIYRIDSMADISAEPLVVKDGGFVALTVDRTNDLLYYSDGSSLWQSDLDGNSEQSLSLAGPPEVYSINGIAMGESGYLYIAGTYFNGAAQIPYVFQYDPAGQTVVNYRDMSGYGGDCWDALLTGNTVLAAVNGSNNKMVSLSKDLQTENGVLAQDPVSSDPMLGPRRFLSEANSTLYILDEEMSYNDSVNRILSIEDESGTGWTTFYPGDIGKTYFGFFLPPV